MDLVLPALGEGSDSGTVVNLFVKEGDSFAKDQPILELENEKAVATIPAAGAGVVSKVFVKTGDRVSVGQKLLSYSAAGAAEATAAVAASAIAPARTAAAPQPAPPVVAAAATAASGSATQLDSIAPAAASPSIRKLARDLGIDLTRVPSRTESGRIVLGDVRAYIERLQELALQPKAAPGAAPKPAAESPDFSKWGRVTSKPLSPLRQVISRRMTENWCTIPHVTQFDDADLTTVLRLRKQHLEAYEKKSARLTVTCFVLKALAATLRKHPNFNSSLDEAAQTIVFKEYVHIGIAVDTESGLIVPVIRDVDQKNLVQLAKELESVAIKARERKVTAEELKGGTFTLSNQGGIGGAHFTPIVNKPEVAILGLGRATARPVARDGKMEIRTLMPIGLSYDHRVIDGGAAARFTVDLIQAIEGFDEKAVEL